MTTEMIVTIIIAVVGSSGVWGFLQWLLETKVKKRNKLLKDMKDKLDSVATRDELKDISEELAKIKTTLDTDNKLTLSIAREKLNSMSNQYLLKGYIPMDEYVAYYAIAEAYIQAGGNSEIKSKFELVDETLDVKAISDK